MWRYMNVADLSTQIGENPHVYGTVRANNSEKEHLRTFNSGHNSPTVNIRDPNYFSSSDNHPRLIPSCPLDVLNCQVIP